MSREEGRATRRLNVARKLNGTQTKGKLFVLRPTFSRSHFDAVVRRAGAQYHHHRRQGRRTAVHRRQSGAFQGNCVNNRA